MALMTMMMMTLAMALMVMKMMAVLVSVLPRIHMANQQADTMKINLKVSANISFDCAHITFVGDLIIL